MTANAEVQDIGTADRPLTVSNPELVIEGSDHDFRELLALLSATAGRMQSMRRELAKALGVSIAEFSVLTALMHLEQKGNVRVRTVADHLHIAAAHVTLIVKQLALSGWVLKTVDLSDSRAVSLRLTAEAQEKLALFAPLLCAVNDRWFAGMSRSEMRTASEFMQRLIGQYDSAIIKAQDMRNDLS